MWDALLILPQVSTLINQVISSRTMKHMTLDFIKFKLWSEENEEGNVNKFPTLVARDDQKFLSIISNLGI